MSRLYTLLGFVSFGVTLFGGPSKETIEKFREYEIGINSGCLSEAESHEKARLLMQLISSQLQSRIFSDDIMKILDENAANETDKKNFYLYIFRFYAFPTDPIEIRYALENLFSEDVNFSDDVKYALKKKENRNTLFTFIKNIHKSNESNESNESNKRFLEIINAQKSDYENL